MPINIPRVSIRELDRLVAAVASPSLLYGADGTGGASSSRQTLVVSLPTVATNEVAEISLPTVASLLPAVSLTTVTTETLLVVSLPTVTTDPNLQSATIVTSAGTSSIEGPRSLAVSDSLVNSCLPETRIDHHIDNDNHRVSVNSYRAIDGSAE